MCSIVPYDAHHSLYCFVFLMFAAIGGSRYSLDNLLDAESGADTGDVAKKPGKFKDARRQRRIREQRTEAPIDSQT